MQLRKCCAHPALFEQNSQPLANIAALKAFTAASGKLALLDQMVRAFLYKFQSINLASGNMGIIWSTRCRRMWTGMHF